MCKHRHAAFGLGLVCRPAGTAGRQLCRSTRLSARGLAAVSVYCATAAALGWQRSDSGSDYAVQLLLLKELHKAKNPLQVQRIFLFLWQVMKKSLSRDSNGRSAKDFMLNLYYFSRRYLIHRGGVLYFTTMQYIRRKGVFELEHIKESREDEKNDWYMSGLLC